MQKPPKFIEVDLIVGVFVHLVPVSSEFLLRKSATWLVFLNCVSKKGTQFILIECSVIVGVDQLKYLIARLTQLIFCHFLGHLNLLQFSLKSQIIIIFNCLNKSDVAHFIPSITVFNVFLKLLVWRRPLNAGLFFNLLYYLLLDFIREKLKNAMVHYQDFYITRICYHIKLAQWCATISIY